MPKDFRKINMQQYRDEVPKGSVEYWLRHIEGLGVGNYRVIASNLRYAMRQLRKAMAQDPEPYNHVIKYGIGQKKVEKPASFRR